MISDRDSIIAISGASKKEYLEKRISPELEKIMEEKDMYTNGMEKQVIKIIYEDESSERYSAQVIAPIVMQGEALGSVILVSNDETSSMGDVEIKLVETAAGFLSKQMEN